jgi:uncharacterized protein
MRATQGRVGRVFVLRLDDGDSIPSCIEEFALDNRIMTGQVVFIGGIGSGEVVVGPHNSVEMPPQPMVLPVDGAHEVVGLGLLAPDEAGKPVLHIHGAMGRSGQTLTGCMRLGVSTWLVGEAIIYEILDVKTVRRPDARSGFTLLEI